MYLNISQISVDSGHRVKNLEKSLETAMFRPKPSAGYQGVLFTRYHESSPVVSRRRGDILNFNLCQKTYVDSEQAARKRNTDGNRSSVSSEGFCENEPDGDMMSEGDVAAMVAASAGRVGVGVGAGAGVAAGAEAAAETDSQEGGGSDSSTSSSNSHGASNSSSGSRPHPKRRSDSKDPKGACREP